MSPVWPVWKLLCNLISGSTSWLKVLVHQSSPKLCGPVNCSPPEFLHGILQARMTEWVAILFPRGSPRPRDRTWVSRFAGILFTIWATREAEIIFVLARPEHAGFHFPRPGLEPTAPEVWARVSHPQPWGCGDCSRIFDSLHPHMLVK